MVIHLKNCQLKYEMEKLSLAFFPYEKFQVIEEPPYVVPTEDGLITVTYTEGKEEQTVTVTYSKGTIHTRSTESADRSEQAERLAGRALYRCLKEATGIAPAWGILTGVRPSKLMTKYRAEQGEEAAKKYFSEKLLTSPEKVELAARVSKVEEAIIATSQRNHFSLYISIPFCPNRCSYCSFVSHSINTPGAKKLLPDYFEHLLEELKLTGEAVKGSTLKLASVYVGGGTPSTLSAQQIRRLIATVKESFDLSDCKEFTFEAGRPDTITEEKLQAIFEGGVDRISINPQTMTDEILKSIGRDHTVEDIKYCFATARRIGFTNINMDLIAGLEGDTPENFTRSLKEVLSLDPESVTVHALAYKRSSNLVLEEELFSRGKETAQMVNASNALLADAGYVPYYMYRQTRSLGNLENVGWSKPGKESYYNIYMMEECHTILSCGAGAVTKLKTPGDQHISRLFNYKYPYEYNTRFEELMTQKETLKAFIEEHHKEGGTEQ